MSLLTGIITLSISSVVMANVLIYIVKNTSGCSFGDCTNPNNTAGTWSGTETAMWGLISLVGILGIMVGVLQIFGLFG